MEQVIKSISQIKREHNFLSIICITQSPSNKIFYILFRCTCLVTYSLFQTLCELSVNRKRLTSLNLSGTNTEQTGTRPPNCTTPRQLTIYILEKMTMSTFTL